MPPLSRWPRPSTTPLAASCAVAGVFSPLRFSLPFSRTMNHARISMQCRPDQRDGISFIHLFASQHSPAIAQRETPRRLARPSIAARYKPKRTRLPSGTPPVSPSHLQGGRDSKAATGTLGNPHRWSHFSTCVRCRCQCQCRCNTKKKRRRKGRSSLSLLLLLLLVPLRSFSRRFVSVSGYDALCESERYASF